MAGQYLAYFEEEYTSVSAYPVAAGLTGARFFLQGYPVMDKGWQKIGSRTGAAQKNARSGAAVSQDLAPFLNESRVIVPGQPVLVVQKYEVRIAPRVLLEKPGDALVVRTQPVRPIAQGGEMMLP
jgi:hypothetical protein